MPSADEAPARRRLFFALWPDDAVRAQLRRLSGHLARRTGGRRVRAENLHITLAFLGRVDEPTRHCLQMQAAAIAFEPFEFTLDRVGLWRRPRVVWTAATQLPEPLTDLASALARGLRECGLTPESRPFVPHATLLRKASRAPRQDEIAPIHWRAEAFALVESRTRPEGAEYRTLARWPGAPQI